MDWRDRQDADPQGWADAVRARWDEMHDPDARLGGYDNPAPEIIWDDVEGAPERSFRDLFREHYPDGQPLDPNDEPPAATWQS